MFCRADEGRARLMGVIPFYFVDVFADRPLTGNPLTLVPDADGLTVEQMKAVAREFNQSETTFLVDGGEHQGLRSFTPAGHEVGGAGHNALGAWLWLAENRLATDEPSVTLRQRIGSDVLPVEIRREPGQPVRVVMDQGTPVFGARIDDPAGLARALSLGPAQVGDAQVVSTGAGHLLVRIATREAVDAAVPHGRELAAILAEAGGEGCYLYSTEGGEPYTRFFNPTVGIVEDPATGTAAGPLAVLLARSGQVPADAPVFIEQGHHLGRPSRIRVDVDGDTVRLSGSGLVVGRGELRVA